MFLSTVGEALGKTKDVVWAGDRGQKKTSMTSPTGVTRHMFMISCPPTHAILCITFPFTPPTNHLYLFTSA